MTEDVLVRLRQSLPGLRPSEQRIARAALANPAVISGPEHHRARRPQRDFDRDGGEVLPQHRLRRL